MTSRIWGEKYRQQATVAMRPMLVEDRRTAEGALVGDEASRLGHCCGRPETVVLRPGSGKRRDRGTPQVSKPDRIRVLARVLSLTQVPAALRTCFCSWGLPCSRSERQLLLYPAKAVAGGPLAVLGLDVAPSTLLPSYDPDTSLVLLTGKVGWSVQAGVVGR